jgi:hypothetical protein
MLAAPLLVLPLLLSGQTPAQATNLRCPVTGFDVSNRRMHHWVTVQGRSFYVFDHRAAELLKRWPEGYLREDRTNSRVPHP